MLNTQVVAQFSLKMCVAAEKGKKITKNPYCSRSFKIINVDTNKKLVNRPTACYDKPHVYAYLQPFSRYMR